MTLPYLNKAVHVDDPVYIYVARQILQDPARPFAFQLNWFGVSAEALQSHWHPPLLSYYYALLISFFGESEIALHAGLIVFPLLAAYSAFFLARRFTSRPLAATLLIVLSPAFFVSASTLMLDVPVLACTLASMALFIHGLDRNRSGLLAGSGIVLAAACLIKYSAVLQFGILWLYACQRGQAGKALAPLGLAFAIVSGWVYIHFLESGTIHPLLALKLEGGLAISKVQNLSSLFSCAGASLLLAGCFSFPNKRRMYAAMGAAMALGLFLAIQSSDGLGMGSSVLLFLFTVNGAYLFGLLFAGRLPKDRDTVFLALWLLVSVLFIPAAIAFNAMRHTLIFLVPLVLLLFRTCRTSVHFEKIFPANLAAVFFISLGISYADYHFAESYRRYAVDVFKETRRDAPDSQVWFRAHWGFQYYMENLGGRFLEKKNAREVREGDWFVDVLQAHHHRVPPQLENALTRVARRRADRPWPVRLMNLSTGAGWYANIWGPLPFTLSRAPLETFSLYRAGGPGKDKPAP